MKLELTINDVNMILQALGAAPYGQVFELVSKIQMQAQSQVQAPTPSQIEAGDE
jgi:hypothetical protein